MQSVARLPIFHVLFNEAKKSFPLEPRFIHESDFSSGKIVLRSNGNTYAYVCKW